MPETLSLGATGTLPFSDTTLLLPYLLPRELATFARYQAWFFIRSHLFFFLFIKVSDRVQELHSRLGPCRSSGVAPLSPGQTCFVSFFFFFFHLFVIFLLSHLCFPLEIRSTLSPRSARSDGVLPHSTVTCGPQKTHPPKKIRKSGDFSGPPFVDVPSKQRMPFGVPKPRTGSTTACLHLLDERNAKHQTKRKPAFFLFLVLSGSS